MMRKHSPGCQCCGCPGGGKVFRLTHANGCAAVGATVDFLVGGVIVFSGTTDSNGRILFPGASASITYTINWSFAGLTGTLTSVGCAGAQTESTVPPGYVQNCVFPIPTLYITDKAGTREIWPNPACVNFDYPIAGFAKQWKSQLDAIGTCASPLWRVTTREYNTIPGPCDVTQLIASDTAQFVMSCTSPMSFSGVTTGTAWGGGDKAFMIHE